jgi:hypothetical protein
MAFVISPYSIVIEERYSPDDVVYIVDTDKIGIVDDILYLETNEVVLVLDMGETFILAPIDDPYIIKLDHGI